ncbi:hypothetical protein CRUP_024036 [Coryphaenoides rupestris]|nr:hypothetical protein CRUP_024036 [Coryphaenoides rupestris]
MTSCRLQHLPRGSGTGAMATRMDVYLITALFSISVIFTSFFGSADGQAGSFNEITGFSLSPPYFNLAQGARVSATATCGQDEGQFCDQCNSNEPNKAHPVTNAIDGTERWWQSPPLSRGPVYNQVNITLDLGQVR